VQQAEDHFDDGALARAVGTEQAEDLVGPDLEVDVVDGLGFGAHPEVAEDLGQADALDDGRLLSV